LIHFWYHYTSSGLWVQFAGEHPEALLSSGVSPKKVRWFFVILGGALAAWGGATLSIFLASSYSPLMSAGRGFMSLAALIFGRWKPIPTLLACLFFGFTDALQIQLQGVQVYGHLIPVQFVQILPYIITILAVSGVVGSTNPPKALGQ
jgi:simple sugar transport system permease protein